MDSFFDFLSGTDDDEENDSLYILRTSCNGLIFYKINDLQIGGGITAHSMVHSTPLGTSETNGAFETSYGLVIDTRMYHKKTEYFGARLILIDYTRSNDGRSYDGNSIGLMYGFAY